MRTRQPIVIPKKGEETEAKRWSFQDIKYCNFPKIFIRLSLAIIILAILSLGVLILISHYQLNKLRNKIVDQDIRYFKSFKLPADLVTDAYADKATFRWRDAGVSTQYTAYLVLAKTFTRRQLVIMGERNDYKAGIPFTDLTAQQRKLAKWLILYVHPGDPTYANENNVNWMECTIGVIPPKNIEHYISFKQ